MQWGKGNINRKRGEKDIKSGDYLHFPPKVEDFPPKDTHLMDMIIGFCFPFHSTQRMDGNMNVLGAKNLT
jgi:hypothetical protein